MERLTERWCAGGIRIKGCSTLYPDVERKSAPMASAIARLSAYEDAMPLERVQELAQAEKDGRLVVLQDDITIQDLQDEYCRAKCAADTPLPSPSYVTGHISGFGDGVVYALNKILAREEAESALKKREEADSEAD